MRYAKGDRVLVLVNWDTNDLRVHQGVIEECFFEGDTLYGSYVVTPYAYRVGFYAASHKYVLCSFNPDKELKSDRGYGSKVMKAIRGTSSGS